MIPISSKHFKQILKNNTILTPEQIFTNLGIDNKDFITFDELCSLSRKETLKKLYALRDMCNLDFAKYDLIDGLAYEEGTRPTLTLLFQPCAVSRFKMTEFREVPNDVYIEQQEEKEQKKEESEEDKENKESENKKAKAKFPTKKKETETLPAYSINEELLDYLLTTKNLSSKLDKFLIEKHRPLLELYKEFLENGTFYPDFKTCDATGNVLISSKHENYLSLGEIDSIVIPRRFGEIKIRYSDAWTTYKATYTPIEEEIIESENVILPPRFEDKVFIHKALLPKNYSNPQK